jgi:PAS domain S-box-containing protein
MEQSSAPSPEAQPTQRKLTTPGKITLAATCIGILWTFLVLASIWREVAIAYRSAEEHATSAARLSVEQSLLLQEWAAGNSITVASNSTETDQKPAAAPARSGTSKSMSHACLIRTVQAHSSSPITARIHLTSLNPLNPKNAPDEWEISALHAFDNGKTEAVATATLTGQPFLRYSRPLLTERLCMGCHAAQGYREGDIRGGIVTSVPLAQFYLTANGEIREYAISHTAVWLVGLAGLVACAVVVLRILSSRDKIVYELEQKEHGHRQLSEQLPLLCMSCSIDGTITYANPALLRLVGRREAELVGHHFADTIVPQQQRETAIDEFNRNIVSKTNTRTHGHVIDTRGGTRLVGWMHTLLTDASGQPVAITSLGEDITAKNEEDLHHRLLSCAVEQSPASVVITDEYGSIVYVNPQFSRTTGYSPVEVLGKKPGILAYGDTPKAIYRHLWECIRNGHNWQGLFHNRRKNGEEFWEQAHISPIRAPDGAIVRYVAVKEDVTARIRAEESLKESEQRFRTLLENVPVGILVQDGSRCLFANPPALELLGHYSHVAPANIDLRSHGLPTSIGESASGKASSLGRELELNRCDGSTLICEYISAPTTYNGSPATMVLLVDFTERHQMVAAVEESESRYRTLVEAAPVAIFTLNNGRFVFANPAAARLFGFNEPTDLVGASLWQRVHADSLNSVTRLVTQASATPQSVATGELTLLRQDRSQIACGAVAIALSVDHESSVLVFANDITERKRLGDALRENEERMRETLESTNAGYFMLDKTDCIQLANTACLGVLEISSTEEAKGRRFLELFPESDRAPVADCLRRLAAGEEFVDGELSRTRADGSCNYYSFTAHLVREQGRIVGCEGFMIDTTAARSHAESYQMLFEQMHDGFALHEIVCDDSGQPVDYRYLAVNPAFERIMGRTASEIIGKRVREIFPTIEQKWIDRCGLVAATGKPVQIKDYSAETRRQVELSLFAPGPGRFACIVRDITENHRLEQQLLQAQKLEAIAQLASGVAHDYNNILVAILMSLSLLRGEPGLRPEVASAILALEREAKRAAGITRQLLLFSRRQPMQPGLVDFNAQIQNMLKMLRRLLGENIAIECELAPNARPLWADPGLLDQVVVNLCLNARDAMPNGGRLDLVTSCVDIPNPVPEYPQRRTGQFLMFSARDSGRGMDSVTIQKIFEPFFTTKEASTGTGLGLATVQSIVQQHQGWVEVESEPGKGSLFRVFLPFAPDETASDSCTPPDRGTETILLVEDDTIARQTISLTLRRDGYHVIEAGSYQTALDIWHKQEGRIGAVVTDVVMPGEHSGFELANALRQLDPKIPMLIFSGYSNEASKMSSQLAGITYLAKPFDYQTLVKALRTSLAGRSP